MTGISAQRHGASSRWAVMLAIGGAEICLLSAQDTAPARTVSHRAGAPI